MDILLVTDVMELSGHGTVAFFDGDPVADWPRCQHTVRINKPDGHQLAAVANVEIAFKDGVGDVIALRFPDLGPTQIPQGSKSSVLADLAAAPS